MTEQPQIKYCLYARKSSESDEKQALSIDSQIKEMTTLAKRENLNVVEIRQEAHSAKESGKRPVYNQLLVDIGKGQFNGILTWAPDRLARNAGDLGSVVDLMDRKHLLEIRTYGQTFTNSPNEKFLLMILGSQAKLENDNRGLNVKRGMKAKAEMGLRPGVAPTGYLNEKRSDRKCHMMVDPERGHIIKQMFEKVAHEKWSGRKLFYWLRDEINFKTKNGKHLSLSNIYIILKNTFYYGVFEYPRKSGNWYTGIHTPLVSKELFDQVQAQIKVHHEFQYRSKEFAFTRLMVCGKCGSGITAQEKFKYRKDGTKNRYVYYGCTRSRDKKCEALYIREENLVNQILELIDRLTIDKLGIQNKLQQEVERYYKFRQSVFGLDEAKPKLSKETDMKNYAKYILTNGNIVEKRELLSCLRNRLTLLDRKVKLAI
ncbi:MAG: recombinase family protein [Patescibacteria group bacterium]